MVVGSGDWLGSGLVFIRNIIRSITLGTANNATGVHTLNNNFIEQRNLARFRAGTNLSTHLFSKTNPVSFLFLLPI